MGLLNLFFGPFSREPVHNPRMHPASRTVTLVALVLSSVIGIPAVSLESDQYYAWGRELPDSTDVLNSKVRLEIDRVLKAVNSKKSGKGVSCEGVVERIVPRFRKFIFQDIELWAVNSSLVARIPATAEEELEFRKHYLYRNTHALDVGTKVPPSPTIELHGVRLGTDKLSHFFSEGWMYYKWYRKYRKSGLSVEEAERRVIRRGIWWERTILGSVSSGVFSIGDLEANYQGLRFLAAMCEGDSPALKRDETGWRYVDAFDFRNYVSPSWDESYQPPIFGKRRWKKVRPALVEYCPMLHDPRVIRQRAEYSRRDRDTPTKREVRKLVEAGRLRDPRQFALDAHCGTAETAAPEPAIALTNRPRS